jgi:folate-binding protein YgfZ
MSVTTFQEKLAASGARLESYRGAETATTFGDVGAEFRALLEGCGLFDMSWQAKLVLSGEDRIRWLNGMVTNNIRDLAPNHGVYSFLLNAQGRIQGDLVAYNRGEYVLVTTDREQVAAIAETFDRYIIMDDVEVADISDKLASIGLIGPASSATLSSGGIDVSRLQPGQVMDTVWRDMGISVARSVVPNVDSYELWFAVDHLDKIWEILAFTGGTPVGCEALEFYRIFKGVPRFGVDLRDRDLPQETGQQHALNFSKGCYIGQEIVERIRARGNVHRTFIGFAVDGEAPQPGTKVRAGDKDVGEITSAARVPLAKGERTLALGYLRKELATPDAVVQIGDESATVQILPFHE